MFKKAVVASSIAPGESLLAFDEDVGGQEAIPTTDAWRPATAREEELVFGLRPHPHRWWRKI